MRMRLPKTYLFVATFSLVLLYAFSFGSVMGMEADKDGQMSPCPFSTTASICKMTFSEHVSLWQSMFTVPLGNNASMLVALGLIFAVSFVLKYLEENRDKELVAYKFYTHEHQKSSTFNKLTELFSRGILNPKIYELAVI